ncbi:hypothetical protein T459_26034 [Capsicum annuum]|uniref:Uncharacterized protein n=1 Tax=Capsicum annuum TaxID=4072 RepID=A0A2G2YMH2_CAPAN|nr:hypothetical protein T459_26034 [Capsicum annuum]
MFDHYLGFHDDVPVLESISVPGETVVEKHNDLSLFNQMDNLGTSNFSIVKMETSSNTGDNEYYLCSDHHRPRDSYAFDIMKTIMNSKKMGIVGVKPNLTGDPCEIVKPKLTGDFSYPTLAT